MGEIPDCGQVMRTLQGRRTSLRTTDCPGDGTAASPLHLELFSLLQSRGSLGHSWTLSTLWERER